MNWDDPAQRARLAIQLGPQAYNRAFKQHLKDFTVAIVNGHRIRPIGTRFGRLYAIGSTGKAHADLEQAKQIARDSDTGPDTEPD